MLNHILQQFSQIYSRQLSLRERLSIVGLGLLLGLLVFGAGLNSQAAGSPGSVDPTFQIGNGPNSTVFAVAVQSDGKVIIGGDFNSYNGTARSGIARLNTDGTLDTAFNPGTGANNIVRAVAVQSDGKVIIGGDFTTYNGTASNSIARLNTDGSLDIAFNVGTGANGSVFAVAVQSDGKVIIGGGFTSYNGTASNRIAQLKTDGTLDTAFNVGSGSSGIVRAVAVQSDGKVIIGGQFLSYNGTAINRIARLNTDGSLDTAFNVGSGPNGVVNAVAVQSDDKVIIGGAFTSVDTYTLKFIARLLGNTPLQTTTTSSLTSSPNPSVFGQSVTFTATVSPITATGTVSFTFDTGSTVSAALSGGNATYISSTLPVGSHIITATYGGDSTYTTSFTTTTQLVNPATSAITLTSDPNPSLVGQSVTFTATVSPTGASGTVTFTEGAIVLGTGTLSGGVATFATNTLTAGSHSITANYSGDGNYAPASSNTLTQVVNVNATTLTLTSSPNPSSVGQSVTFTATVNPIAATGTVTFTFDGATSVMANLSGGIAIYVTSTLSPGSHSVTANYGGDSTYPGATSTPITQLINLNSTSISLTSTPNPSLVGQSVTFTATLSPVSASGTVTFSEGATVLGTAPVVSGTAIYTTNSFSIGSHVITANYSGNSTYAMALSQPITQVVQAACAPLVVTSVTDNGSGTTCGTLSYALSQPITGSTPVTITFALTHGNTITFTGSLTTTAKVKAHVTILGGTFGSTSRIILNGNGVAGDGLHLAGQNYLVNLTIKKFGGRELVLEGTGNRMQGVVVDAS